MGRCLDCRPDVPAGILDQVKPGGIKKFACRAWGEMPPDTCGLQMGNCSNLTSASMQTTDKA